MWLQGLLIGLALAAFVLIAIEDVIHLNKAKTTLLLGTFSWLLLFIFGPAALAVEDVPEALNENLLEIACTDATGATASETLGIERMADGDGPVVTIVTPVANWPNTCRSCSGSSGCCCGGTGTGCGASA